MANSRSAASPPTPNNNLGSRKRTTRRKKCSRCRDKNLGCSFSDQVEPWQPGQACDRCNKSRDGPSQCSEPEYAVLRLRSSTSGTSNISLTQESDTATAQLNFTPTTDLPSPTLGGGLSLVRPSAQFAATPTPVTRTLTPQSLQSRFSSNTNISQSTATPHHPHTPSDILPRQPSDSVAAQDLRSSEDTYLVKLHNKAAISLKHAKYTRTTDRTLVRPPPSSMSSADEAQFATTESVIQARSCTEFKNHVTTLFEAVEQRRSLFSAADHELWLRRLYPLLQDYWSLFGNPDGIARAGAYIDHPGVFKIYREVLMLLKDKAENQGLHGEACTLWGELSSLPPHRPLSQEARAVSKQTAKHMSSNWTSHHVSGVEPDPAFPFPHVAVVFGQISLVQPVDCCILIRDLNQYTPIHILVVKSDTVMLREALEHNSTLINERDCLGRTALILASHMGCVESAAILLDNGADYDLYDRRSCTAMSTAIEENHFKVVQLFLERGLSPAGQRLGHIPVHLAALHQRWDIMQVLLERAVRLDLTFSDLEHYDPMSVQLLIEGSGCPNIIGLFKQLRKIPQYGNGNAMDNLRSHSITN